MVRHLVFQEGGQRRDFYRAIVGHACPGQTPQHHDPSSGLHPDHTVVGQRAVLSGCVQDACLVSPFQINGDLPFVDDLQVAVHAPHSTDIALPGSVAYEMDFPPVDHQGMGVGPHRTAVERHTGLDVLIHVDIDGAFVDQHGACAGSHGIAADGVVVVIVRIIGLGLPLHVQVIDFLEMDVYDPPVDERGIGSQRLFARSVRIVFQGCQSAKGDVLHLHARLSRYVAVMVFKIVDAFRLGDVQMAVVHGITASPYDNGFA